MVDDEVQIEVRDTNSLTSQEMNRIIELFEANYDEADPSYIHKRVDALKYIAMATT